MHYQLVRRSLWVFALLALTLTWVYFVHPPPTNQPITTTPSPQPQAASPFPVAHYRLEDVSRGVKRYPPQPIAQPKRQVVGGVVAHHLVVQETLAQYFQNLSAYPYRRVILLGPNHGELGESRVVTSSRDWDTPYGRVPTDQVLTHQLSRTCVKSDSYPLENDHALEVIMPFIKVYLSEAKVVPLLLSGQLTMPEIDDLVTCLTPFLDANTLVLVSSDFSHYLMSSTARQKDRETLALLKSWDTTKLLTLTSTHLDSPPSLVMLLKLMQVAGAYNYQVFAHTDASQIMGTPHQATTTHLFLNYY